MSLHIDARRYLIPSELLDIRGRGGWIFPPSIAIPLALSPGFTGPRLSRYPYAELQSLLVLCLECALFRSQRRHKTFSRMVRPAHLWSC
jgi:hypothetical protein